MPLEDWQRADVAASASGMIGAAHGQIDAATITRRLTQPGARYYGTDMGEQTSIYNEANRQLRAFRDGGDMQDSSDVNGTVTPKGIDWTLWQRPDRYGYRVRVSVTNLVTGEQSDRLIVVGSDSPLSPAEVRGQAEADYRGDPTRQGRYPERWPGVADIAVEPIIIAIGRRP